LVGWLVGWINGGWLDGKGWMNGLIDGDYNLY
jgi:hypothetical protein